LAACHGRVRLLGVAATSLSAAAGALGVAVGLALERPLEVVLGSAWLLVSYAAYRTYRGLCGDEDLVGPAAPPPG